VITLKRVVRKFHWIVLLHVVLFSAFWLTNAAFYSYANDYLTGLFGAQHDYVSLCLWISGAVGLWTAARLLSFRREFRHPLSLLSPWLHATVALIYIVFFYGSFWLLLRKSPVQLPRVGQLLLYLRVILDPVLLLAATVVAALWMRRRMPVRRPDGIRAYSTAVVPALAPLVLMWGIMLAFPPTPVYQGALPAKPLIIAHRGASTLAPENTLAAFERAAQPGTFGVEFDLSISRDGIPFLMHDDDLARTTNVAQVFPGREKDRAESFALAEVRQLNAGEWFVRSDPYKTVANGAVSEAEAKLYTSQMVPTLAELLDVVRRYKFTFIFDLKEPPADHPYGKQFFDIVFKQIHQAGIDSQVWFLVDRNQLKVIRADAPEMKPAYGVDFLHPPDAMDLAAQGYRIVNAEYGLSEDWIRQYHEAGLWVNIYTVDEAWQFSRLWLLGVNSITTSNAQEMVALAGPILSLPYSLYLPLWVGVGLLVLVILGLAVRQRLANSNR
jgi:glycerophosphoryl diester phosphodiesterase